LVFFLLRFSSYQRLPPVAEKLFAAKPQFFLFLALSFLVSRTFLFPICKPFSVRLFLSFLGNTKEKSPVVPGSRSERSFKTCSRSLKLVKDFASTLLFRTPLFPPQVLVVQTLGPAFRAPLCVSVSPERLRVSCRRLNPSYTYAYALCPLSLSSAS